MNNRIDPFARIIKGRGKQGKWSNPRGRPARFSPTEVEEIRRKHQQGASIAYLARSYYVSQPTIRDIVHRRNGYRPKETT